MLRPFLRDFIQVHNAVFNRLQQSLLAFLSKRELTCQLVDAILPGVLCDPEPLAHFSHHDLQTLGSSDSLSQLTEHGLVGFLHRQVTATAGSVALAMAAGAFVVFVLSALPGDQGHLIATLTAFEQPSQ